MGLFSATLLFIVTTTGPEVSLGVIKVSEDDEASVTVADVPLMVTMSFDGVGLKLAPEIFTDVPTGPVSGDIP